MPINPKIRQCKHLKVTGDRCGSPAMTGYDRCYYHARSPMGIDDFVVPDITDPTARSKALTEIFNGLTTNKLDTKRASAMFYAIQIASDRLR